MEKTINKENSIYSSEDIGKELTLKQDEITLLELKLKEAKDKEKQLKENLKNKKREEISKKIIALTPFYQEHILPNIPHSPSCQQNSWYSSPEKGFRREGNGNIWCYCPHCALESVLNEPYLGIDIELNIDFDYECY